MTNEQNLKLISSTKEARELGRKGGQSTSLAKKLSKRKYCNSKCPIYDRCWAKHTSQSIAKKKEEENSKAGIKEIVNVLCAIKNMPTRVIERTARLVTEGEDGLIKEMIDTMARLGTDLDIEQDSKAKERYLYQIRETMKTIYGTKNRFEGKVDTNANIITAESFAQAYEKVKKEEEKHDGTEEPKD